NASTNTMSAAQLGCRRTKSNTAFVNSVTPAIGLLPRLPPAGPSKARGDAICQRRTDFGLGCPHQIAKTTLAPLAGRQPARVLLIPRCADGYRWVNDHFGKSKGGRVGCRVPSAQASLCRQLARASGAG